MVFVTEGAAMLCFKKSVLFWILLASGSALWPESAESSEPARGKKIAWRNGIKECHFGRASIYLKGRREDIADVDIAGLMDAAIDCWQWLNQRFGQVELNKNCRCIIVATVADCNTRAKYRFKAFPNGGVQYLRMELICRAKELTQAAMVHEMVHLYLCARFGGSLPLWIHEGIAVFCENKDKKMGSNRSEKFQQMIAAGVDYPLAELQAAGCEVTRPMPERFYAASALAVSALHRKKGDAGLIEFIEKIAAGENLEKALESIFALSALQLDRSVRSRLE